MDNLATEMINSRPSCTVCGEYNDDFAIQEVIHHPANSQDEDTGSVISKLVSNAVIHALDSLLTAILSPFLFCQWLSKNDHLLALLTVILEVFLELVVLVVIAGVSILTAATLILDDLYCTEENAKTPQKIDKVNEVEVMNRRNR